MPTDRSEDGSWSLPGYRIGEVLGRGGFATVYRARQLSLDRDVAVKVISADLVTEGDRRRFQRERLSLSRLSVHPNIVEVHDAGITPENRPYLVMRLYPNGSLSDRIVEQGPVPVDDVITIATAIASALDEAHGAGILHRDVKPSNVLLTEDGTPVLADFGIAGLITPDPASSQPSTAVFSLAYVAPEILSENQYSIASDVYALAATIYQLLTGRPPFPPTDPRIGSLILDESPPPLDVPGLPPQVEAAVLRGLAKNPEDRPRSAGDFARSLTGPIPAGGTGTATTQISPRIPPRPDPFTMTTRPVATPNAPAQPSDTVANRPVRSRRKRFAVFTAVVVFAVVLLIAGVGVARLGVVPNPFATTDTPTVTSSVSSTADQTMSPSPVESTQASPSPSIDVVAVPYCSHSEGGLVQLPPEEVYVSSSSTKPAEDGLYYGPESLLDGDTATAWVEGVDGLGEEESITFTFSYPVTLVTICLVNGYGKSTDLYQRNARVKTMDVITDTKQFTVELRDQGLADDSSEFQPGDPSEFQRFPVLEQEVIRVTLSLRSFYGPDEVPGLSSYEDTCLSEVQFWFLPEPDI